MRRSTIGLSGCFRTAINHCWRAAILAGVLAAFCGTVLAIAAQPGAARSTTAAGPAIAAQLATAAQREAIARTATTTQTHRPADRRVRCGDEPKRAARDARPLPQGTIRVKPGQGYCRVAAVVRDRGFKVGGDRPVTAQYLWEVNRGRRVIGNFRLTDPDVVPVNARLRLRVPAAQSPGERPGRSASPSPSPSPSASPSGVAQPPGPAAQERDLRAALLSLGLLVLVLALVLTIALLRHSRRVRPQSATMPLPTSSPDATTMPASATALPAAAPAQAAGTPAAGTPRELPSKRRLLAWTLLPGLLIGMFSGLGQLLGTVLDAIEEEFEPTKLQLSLAAVATLVGIVFSLAFISPRLDRLNRRKVVLVLSIVTAGLLALLPVAGSVWWLIAIGAGIGIFGVAEGPMRAIIRFRRPLPDELDGVRSGFINAWFALGSMILLFGAPYLTKELGWQVSPLWTAGAVLCVGVLTWLVMPNDPSDDRPAENERSLWRALRERAVWAPGAYGGLNGIVYGIPLAPAALILTDRDKGDWIGAVGLRYGVAFLLMLLLARWVEHRRAPALASWATVWSIATGVLALQTTDELFLWLWLGQYFLLESAGMWLWAIAMHRSPKNDGVGILGVIVIRVGGIAMGYWLGVLVQQTANATTALCLSLGLALVHGLISNRLLRGLNPGKEESAPA